MDGFFTNGYQVAMPSFLFVDAHQLVKGKAGKDPVLQFAIEKFFPAGDGAFTLAPVPERPGQAKQYGLFSRMLAVAVFQKRKRCARLSVRGEAVRFVEHL